MDKLQGLMKPTTDAIGFSCAHCGESHVCRDFDPAPILGNGGPICAKCADIFEEFNKRIGVRPDAYWFSTTFTTWVRDNHMHNLSRLDLLAYDLSLSTRPGGDLDNSRQVRKVARTVDAIRAEVEHWRRWNYELRMGLDAEWDDGTRELFGARFLEWLDARPALAVAWLQAGHTVADLWDGEE